MWIPPSDLHRRFLIRAASNALAASDAKIYERAFDNAKFLLNGEQAVKRLGVPSPAIFAPSVADPLSRTVETSQLLRGLYLREYFQEHPEQLPNFTSEYFTPTEIAIAGL